MTHYSSPRKYPYPPSPGRRATEKQRGGGGGVQKEAISEEVGVASLVFFIGAPSKIDEQAIGYFTFNRCFRPKRVQKLLCSWMIFYLRPTECFFHGLHDSSTVKRLSSVDD